MTTSSGRLAPAERAALLGIAKAAVRERVARGPAPALPESGPLAERRGAFVTLTVSGELRGCVGTFAPKGSLAATVARMAACAATEDPRFAPIGEAELEEMDVHVSALDPRRPMRDLSDLVIGRDGVLVQLGWHRGALLPRVALEEGWDRETFLARTCLKAGLPPDAWRDPAAKVELFSAEEFGGDTSG